MCSGVRRMPNVGLQFCTERPTVCVIAFTAARQTDRRCGKTICRTKNGSSGLCTRWYCRWRDQTWLLSTPEPKHNEIFYRYLSLLQHLLLAVCVTPLTSSFLNMLVVQDNLLAHNFAKILTVFEVVSLQTRQQISAEVTRLRAAFYVRWQQGTARIRPPSAPTAEHLSRAAVDRYTVSCPPGPQQQTYSSGFAVAGLCCDSRTDRRTNTVPLLDPAPHTMRQCQQ